MINHLGWHLPDLDRHWKKHISEFPKTIYQQESIDESLKYVERLGTVIDIGANIGLHTVRFAQIFEQVIAFEPVLINHECLEKNCSAFPNITLHNVGLGKDRDRMIISMPTGWDSCGAFSLVDFVNDDRDLISQEINIIPLDDLDLDADLIKIDAQGFELEILEGAKQTISKNKPVLLLEIESKKRFGAFSSLLSSIGYQFVKSARKDRIWVHKDTLTNMGLS